ncbi:hypothetical protein M2146_001118 [Lachnospiraceae bacterium PF1-22]
MYEKYKINEPFRDDNFPKRVPYILFDNAQDELYNPVNGQHLLKDSLDEKEVRPITKATKKFNVSSLYGYKHQFYFVQIVDNYFVLRFFSIPMIYDDRKPLPVYQGYRETVRIYITKSEGLLFETSEKIEKFHYSKKMMNRLRKYSMDQSLGKSLSLPLSSQIDGYLSDKKIKQIFTDFFSDYGWLCVMSDHYLANEGDLLINLNALCVSFQRYERLLYKDTVSLPNFILPKKISTSEKFNNTKPKKIAVLEIIDETMIFHYYCLTERKRYEYARNIFSRKGEESYIQFEYKKWIKTKQIFFKKDYTTELHNYLVNDKKILKISEDALQGTVLEHLCIDMSFSSNTCLKYIFHAKKHRFWEQALKCGFGSWVMRCVDRMFYTPSFLHNKNFTDVFSMQEWKKIFIYSRNPHPQDIEKIYNLVRDGFSIPAAIYALNGYSSYILFSTYNKLENKESFIKLVNTLFKRDDKSLGEYEDYLNMIQEFPKNIKESYPLIIPRKKVHNYHQRAVYTQLKIKKKKEKKYFNAQQRLYDKLLSDPKKNGLDFFYENKDFFISHAPTIESLLDEGELLHHCVALYMEEVASGRTTIYYLRKKNDPKTPFFTVEICKKKVWQVFTIYDSPIKESSPEYTFLLKWMNQYNLTGDFYYLKDKSA